MATEATKMTDLATPPLDRPTPAKIERPRRGAKTGPAVVSVTATQLGEHIALTRQRVGVLADVEHVIERLPDGRFDQDDSRLRYLRWLRDPQRRSARSEAASEFAKAKTELIRLRIAEREGKLIELSESIATIDLIIGTVLTHLGGMAARCTRDLQIRRNIDAVVHQIRTEIADAARRHADARGEPPEEIEA